MKPNNIIVEHWRAFAKLSNGDQKKYFEKKIKDGHVAKCVSVQDVFSNEEIALIKKFCKIEPKMCYRTAYRLTNLFPDKVKYVEGEVTVFNGGLGIDHAWNLVDGEHYVDLTMEFALNKDVTKETYVALGEYDADTIREVACDTMVYGGVYNHLTIKDIKRKKTSRIKKH